MSRPDPWSVLPAPVALSSAQREARSQAARQLEIAALYLTAAENLDTGSREMQRSVRRLSGGVESARRELLAQLG